MGGIVLGRLDGSLSAAVLRFACSHMAFSANSRHINHIETSAVIFRALILPCFERQMADWLAPFLLEGLTGDLSYIVPSASILYAVPLAIAEKSPVTSY
jgi:hypothetical protein